MSNIKNISEIIGAKLQRVRQKGDITQEEIAAISHLSKSQISRLERGESTPSVNTLIAYCRALHLSPNDVLLDENTSIDDLYSIMNKAYELKQKSRPEYIRVTKDELDSIQRRSAEAAQKAEQKRVYEDLVKKGMDKAEAAKVAGISEEFNHND